MIILRSSSVICKVVTLSAIIIISTKVISSFISHRRSFTIQVTAMSKSQSILRFFSSTESGDSSANKKPRLSPSYDAKGLISATGGENVPSEMTPDEKVRVVGNACVPTTAADALSAKPGDTTPNARLVVTAATSESRDSAVDTNLVLSTAAAKVATATTAATDAANSVVANTETESYIPVGWPPLDNLEPGWRAALRPQFAKPYFQQLLKFLGSELASKKVVFPPSPQVFSALNLCPLHRVKVVIIGQDPYHGPGQAHGLAFSVQKGVAIPPSLRNMITEARVHYL